MKSKTEASSSFSINDNLGIVRADVVVGSAVRHWLETETDLAEMKFSDIVFALHFVIAREATAYALSKCAVAEAELMRKQICALVSACFEYQFEAALKADVTDARVQ